MPNHEHDLQVKFVQWFVSEHGYREVVSDAEEDYKTSMDSVGFIDSQPTFIEFKHKIGRNSVRHIDGKRSSIEHKISRGLKCLYGDRTESMTLPLLAEWDQKTTPHICLVANRISDDARLRLKEMLSDRSQEWRFDYTVYVWQEEQPIKICEGRAGSSPLVAGHKPEIPDLRNPSSQRQPSSSRKEFRELAESNAVLELYEAMWSHIRHLGGKDTKYRQNINFGFPRCNSGSNSSVVGIWPQESSKCQGLLVSYCLPKLEKCFGVLADIDAQLPGQPVPPRGYLGRSRYLRTVEEVDKFWQVLTDSK